MSLKEKAEERRKEEIQYSIAQGTMETKDGKRIFTSPDGKRYGTIQRTISEKINYSSLLQRQIDNCMFTAQYSYEAFARSVVVLLNLMPTIDIDEQFSEEVKKSTFQVKIPTGRYGGFGGSTYEIMKTKKEYNYFKILRACIDLLRRRGLYTVPKLWDESQVEMFWSRGAPK